MIEQLVMENMTDTDSPEALCERTLAWIDTNNDFYDEIVRQCVAAWYKGEKPMVRSICESLRGKKHLIKSKWESFKLPNALTPVLAAIIENTYGIKTTSGSSEAYRYAKNLAVKHL